MSALTAIITTADVPDPLFRLTVDQYHEMMDAGILTTEDRVELVEGLLVRKMSKYPPHVGTVKRLGKAITPRLPTGWRYRAEQPIILADSEPEPDGVIATGDDEDDDTAHPRSGEIVLVVEVAETSLTFDRTSKMRTYARAGIPTYWLANLVDRQFEVFTDPDPASPTPAYRTRMVFAGDAALPPIVVGSVTIGGFRVESLLARIAG